MIFIKPAAWAFLAAIEEIMLIPCPSETAVITDSVLPSSSAIFRFSGGMLLFWRSRSISFLVPEVSSLLMNGYCVVSVRRMVSFLDSGWLQGTTRTSCSWPISVVSSFCS